MPETADAGVSRSPANGQPRSLMDELYQALGLTPPEEPVHPVIRCLNILLHLIILLLTQLWLGVVMVATKCGFGTEPQDAVNAELHDAGPSELLAAEEHPKSKREVNLDGDARAPVAVSPFPDSYNPNEGLMMLLEEPSFGTSETHGDMVDQPSEVTKPHSDVVNLPADIHAEDITVEEMQIPTVKSHYPSINSIQTPELDEVRVMVGDIIRAEEEIAAEPKGEQNELGKETHNANNKKTPEEQRRPVVNEPFDITDYHS